METTWRILGVNRQVDRPRIALDIVGRAA